VAAVVMLLRVEMAACSLLMAAVEMLLRVTGYFVSSNGGWLLLVEATVCPLLVAAVEMLPRVTGYCLFST
jgi:hypothetical protein